MTDSEVKITPFQQLIIDLQAGKVEANAFFERFLNTELYIGFRKREGDELAEEGQPNFDYLVYPSQQNPEVGTLVVSDVASYLSSMGAEHIMLIKGGDIVATAYENCEISIAFGAGGLGMPVEMVQSLKQAISKQQAQ